MRRDFLKRLSTLPLALAGVQGLSGCIPGPSPLLRVGTNVWVGYEPLYLARALGHYDPGNIRLVEHTSATNVMRALLDGDLEAAGVTLDEALTLISQGLALKVVLVFNFSAGADALVTRPGIETLADLKGKRIAVESGAVGAVMLSALLEAAHLDLADITRVAITANEQVSSYRSGQVDAVIAFEPHVSQLRREGGRVLFDSRAIPNRIMDVLVVRADALPQHEDNLRDLLNGYLAALFHIHSTPEDAHKLMARRLGEDVPGQRAGIHQPDLAENQALLSHMDQLSQNLADFMALSQLLPGRLTTRGLADNSYLPAS
ncbi:MAG: ABC transporter substrate-binding protein [Pseudomonadota bacterium]